MFDLSVIVPTHNRSHFLSGLLQSLAAQDYPADRWELVIVDDGSSDGTREFLRAYQGPCPANTSVISQPQSGVATARNNGARAARGRALLFLDDDMIASPALVGEHARVHVNDPRAVAVGHISVPESGLDPWVRWEYVQVARHYDALKSGVRVPGPRDFYTGNCSVSATLFGQISGFDASLPRTEDLDLGYRLRGVGANFYYREAADSLHLGRHSFDAWLRTSRLYGRCDVVLAWEKGHHELQVEIFRWFNSRQRLSTALVRLCSALPPLETPIVKILDAAGRATSRLGAPRLSVAAYSAINNLAYWLGVIEALGSRKFWDGVKSSKSGPPSPEGTRSSKLPEATLNF
jgi:GT2 family glycosyltransferase